MTAVRGGDNRDLIPRWRPFLPTTRTGELAPTLMSARKGPTSFQEPTAVAAFAESPGLFTAGDLLSQVIVSGRRVPEADDAAHMVRENGSAGAAAHALADHYLADKPSVDDVSRAAEPFNRESAALRVREMRRILRDQPRNAVRWTDLALVHVNLGQLESAARDMAIATSLAPDNRFVLRSAARLYSLLGDPEHGLELLRRASSLNRDPWIQSAEIALSEFVGRPSRRIRAAKQFIDNATVGFLHLSELAGEVATTELRRGSTRFARKYMKTALVRPTDNAVAQAEWASQHGIENPNPSTLQLPRSFEARALDLSARGEHSRAVVEALKWQGDQPFDPDAGIFLSYSATVLLEEYELGVRAAREGLRSNPHNAMLLNNLVFGLASAGRVAEAQSELATLSSLDVDSRQTATIDATRGLVAFRLGRLQEGREHYQRAIAGLTKLGDRDFASMATIFLAREELLAGTPEARDAVNSAVGKASSASIPEAQLWSSRLIERAERAGIPVVYVRHR